ncbi:unnamed protein product [Plutella xylostella]|uniref:(diamondback moth) hypothetical protein n=1 Tax=Plutella xylostella TaxID=51655 RepID=A0A8S4G572_PLUXY|nr:unnamed protein product [Plutella xylostella]
MIFFLCLVLGFTRNLVIAKDILENSTLSVADPDRVEAAKDAVEAAPTTGRNNSEDYWDPVAELAARRRGPRRLFRGDKTRISHFPFVVSVHLNGRFHCGGALYWRDLVVTAASCLQIIHNNRFFRENPAALAVRVGSDYSLGGGELIEALEVYFHPSYDPRLLTHNLALVRLSRHLRLTSRRAPRLIPVRDSGDPLPASAEVLLLGWGTSEKSSKSMMPQSLKKKLLPVYPNHFCKDIYGAKYVTSTMFCVGSVSHGNGACDRDSGGPAVFAGNLVGVISYGPPRCGAAGSPTVLTLVGAYSDWIQEVNDTHPDYYISLKRTTTTTASSMEAKTKKTTEKVDPMQPIDPSASPGELAPDQPTTEAGPGGETNTGAEPGTTTEEQTVTEAPKDEADKPPAPEHAVDVPGGKVEDVTEVDKQPDTPT